MICCSHTVDSVHLGRFKQEKHFNTLPGDVFSHSVTAFVWKVVSEQNQIQMFSYNACLKKKQMSQMEPEWVHITSVFKSIYF